MTPGEMRTHAAMLHRGNHRTGGDIFRVAAEICERLDRLIEVMGAPIPLEEPLPHPPEHGSDAAVDAVRKIAAKVADDYAATARKEAARRLAQEVADFPRMKSDTFKIHNARVNYGCAVPEVPAKAPTIEDDLRELGALGYTVVSVREVHPIRCPEYRGWHVSFRGRGDEEVAAASGATVEAAVRQVLATVRKRRSETVVGKARGEASRQIDRIAAAGWKVVGTKVYSDQAVLDIQSNDEIISCLIVAPSIDEALNKAAGFAERYRGEVK